MADYENLLDSIDAVIRSNNRREITGQILQNTLHQMVGSLGENYQLAGFATPTLDPNSPDQNVFYITDEAGVYTNFDNITLGAGLSFLMWKNEEWTSKTLDVVTADWVDEHYVSKAFLRKVFQFFDEDGVEIFPNDTESVVDNIKAMCGLWTNEYLSALGLGEGSTIPTTLAALNDVTITNPQDGQTLVYDAASLHWVNATIQSGVDMSVVWAALDGSTNEQINISHLTSALSDYVTATSLATTLQSYVTTSALATELANYASQNWVETNYVSKAFFNSLFEAQDVNGNAITPNNSGQTTIDRLKILVGAYTEQYLSALGLSSGGGGGGSSTLAGLNDVTITNPQDGQALIYDAQSSHWVNGAAISMSAVWTALAAATSEQINSSHLTSALSGYVTTSALASELANYVTTSSLATTLADYVTTSALATTLEDYGSKTWIDNNYVSKAFFNRLFQAFAPLAEGQTEPTQVEPNDTTTTIDNIKAMFGLWTEQYLSALGLSAGGGHTIGVLNDLNDVTITNPQTNQVLRYNGTQWVNDTAPSGASALSGLTDVAISSLADKDLLQWDYASGKWKNVVLSTVMSGYATTSQLANYLPLSGGTISGGINPNSDSTINLGTATAKYHYIYAHRLVRLQSIAKGDTYDSYKLDLPDKSGTIAVTSDIPSLSGYATQTWVGNNYLPLSGGALNSGARLKVCSIGTNEYGGGIELREYNYVTNTQTAWDYAPSITFHWGDITVGKFGMRSDGQLAWNNYPIITSKTIGTQSVQESYYASVAGSISWSGVTGAPTALSSFTNDVGYITSSGSCAYATTAGSATDSTKLPLAGGTMTGNISMTPLSAMLNYFSNSSGYGCKIRYSTNNVEALMISQINARSHIWFKCGLDIATTYDWESYTPALDISNQCVAVNAVVSSTTYKLYVNGETNLNDVAYTNSTRGAVHFYVNGTDADFGVMRIYHTSTNGSGSPGNFTATLGIIDERVDNINGAYEPTLYINRTGATRVPDLFGCAIGGTRVATIDNSGNFYCTGGVTALSDARHKAVIKDTTITVEQIAQMPAVLFRWTDEYHDHNAICAGTLAQNWEGVLPQVVSIENNSERTRNFAYGVAALISSITIARKVVNHEERIKALEKENADLKQAYSFIKNAYDYLKMDYEQLKLKIA